ncbi:type II toxin-antitoxin system RelE/ParE family toxin [Zhihengliuella halotolerans]|uniref:type II toxin-antitoxin system RelE/ParE family toxin n=1 Tax=Zhihengliuella halotolerans TaxID=370736 RepID=UPI00102B3A08|nr:type II toxin-antitoxin system RelE/ParE family toxin [Zhihengliuella halotolerans]
MNRYRLTPAAQNDLANIWDYSEDHWDARQAEIDIQDLRVAIERVAEDPSRARRVDDIRQGYLRYSAGSHLVFFTENAGGIDVIRILHQRVDPTRHF